jgi:hypothetical protein
MMGFIKRRNVRLEGTIACSDSRSETMQKEDHLEGVGIRSGAYVGGERCAQVFGGEA